MSDPSIEQSPLVPGTTLLRFRRWAAIAVAVAVIGYVGYAVLRGWRETAEELRQFNWPLYGAVLGLTGVNYTLRYVKWAYLLRRLDVHVPLRPNIWIYLAGLAMVISPGKAGELLKPYLVGDVTDAPMTRTIPALVAERATDAIAIIALAAIGVGTFYAEGQRLIWVTLAAAAVGFAFVVVKPLGLGVIRLLRRIPLVSRFADRIEATYLALRIVAAPVPLLWTLALSIVAWWSECVGFWLIFHGLGADAATLAASTFLYAFATVFGAPSPGGMGMADAALVEGALRLIPGLGPGQAVAAALLVRVATLWFGVVLGAVALLRIEPVLHAHRRRTA